MLPVPLGPFGFNVLQWQENKWYGKVFPTVATIPRNRLQDFLAGENERGETEFVVLRTDPCKSQGKFKKLQSVTTYHCAYGPEDKSSNVPPVPGRQTSGEGVEGQPRKEGSQPVSGGVEEEDRGNKPQDTKARRKPTEYGESVKRGCLAHFDAVVYAEKPEEVEIRYHQQRHVNKALAPCHGKDCPDAGRGRLQPYLSEAARKRVKAELLRQVRPRDIIQHIRVDLAKEYQLANGLNSLEEAMAAMQAKGALNPRDWHIKTSDISNIARSIEGLDWKYDSDQAQSIRCFVKENPKNVLFYQEKTADGLTPFELAVSTPELLALMVEHGDKRPLMLDSTFGTNNLKFPLYTACVMDGQNKILPIAYFISSGGLAESVEHFLQALKDRGQAIKPSFQHGSIHCDDDAAEQLAIGRMWPGVDILLCAFHVKQAWGLKLVQKVSSKEAQKAIGKGLDKLMRFNTAPEHGETLQHHANVQIKEFLAEFQEHTAFVEYFKAHWARRPEKWMQLFRNLRHCNQETTGGIEAYHRVLKEFFLNFSKHGMRARRIDWLLHILLGKVTNSYLQAQHAQDAGFSYSRALELQMELSVVYANRTSVPKMGGDS